MEAQYQHAVLSRPTVDEQGREAFLAAMRRFLITDVYNGNEIAYRERQLPAFVRRHGRPPKSYLEVKAVMEEELVLPGVSLLNRATQELLWDSVGESIERQLPELVAAVHAQPSSGGTLTLDPDFVAARLCQEGRYSCDAGQLSHRTRPR